MKIKRVLFVVGSFPVLSETFIVNQIIGLIDLGFDVRIFSNAENKTNKLHGNVEEYHLLDKIFFNNIKLPKKKYKRVLLAIKLLYKNFNKIQWGILFKTLNFIEYKKRAINLNIFYRSIYFVFNKMPSIIHAHFAPNGINFAELKELNIIPQKVKIIVTFHGYDLMPNLELHYNYKYQLLFKKVDVFTVNTIYLKNILKKIVPSLNNVELLPVGPNLKLFNKSKPNIRLQNSHLEISYCGRLINWKGGYLVLKIAQELKNKSIDFKMNIIGDGELMNELLQKASDYCLNGVVEFYGGVSQEKIKEIFKKSHLFLLPGIEDEFTKRAETQGLVIQEAQAMGLPVLVSDAGGMKYGMIDGKTGFVVPQKDVNSFVDKIIYLKNNEEVRFKMGRNGIDYVQNNFNQNILIKDLIDKVYKT